jgi:hypothetical protein
MAQDCPGFDAMMQYSLFEALANRRSRRISKGIKAVLAGSNSYCSKQEPQPLSLLEEAILIAATGATGVTLPDRPFQSDTGEKILGTPNLNMFGRAAGSTDNAQATHFFLINDSGTFFLKRLEPADVSHPVTPDELIRRAELSKQQVLNHRPDFPREFPYYLDSNRFLSNIPGSTILFPVVDMTKQYINALMYLLTEPEGHRPTFVDDRNFYLPAGVGKWIRRGFLKKDIKLPLGVLGSMRTQIEADLLLQNLILMLQAMGLGGWIHASVAPLHLLGNPYLSKHTGLRFRHVKPRFHLLDLLRWGTFLTAPRSHPIGLDGFIEGMCPPYYTTMADAVQAVVDTKYGSQGIYKNQVYFGRIFKDDRGQRYIDEVPRYKDEVIECVQDVCTYIYETHGRFPAHVDAIYVPGVWLQAHHLDLEYYDALFNNGYTPTQREHQRLWHDACTPALKTGRS